MSQRLCLVVAAEAEFRVAGQVLDELALGSVASLIKSGIGAIGFAERFSKHLANNHFESVLISGLCGALDPMLKKRDVVVYDRCMTAAEAIDLDSDLGKRIAGSLRCVRGVGLSVGEVITEVAEKARLWQMYRASVLDMETHAVLSVCRSHQIRAAAVRVVSDEADEQLPDFNRVLGPEGEIIAKRVPQVLFSRPRASLRFLTSMRPTMDAFRDALRAVIPAALNR